MQVFPMESTGKEEERGVSTTGVIELPGEPAIIINGVPEVTPNNGGLVAPSNPNNGNSESNAGFGEWMEGREVQKLFGVKYYSGSVTEFDKEAGWYRVVYEDGDLEDLDWHELQEVLLPLDVTISLKALALKLVRRNKKAVHKSLPHNLHSKTRGRKIKKTAVD